MLEYHIWHMTFLIEEQICVCHFSMVWGFSWGWGWNVITIWKFCTAFSKEMQEFLYSSSLLPVGKICHCRKQIREVAQFLLRFTSTVQHCERETRVLRSCMSWSNFCCFTVLGYLILWVNTANTVIAVAIEFSGFCFGLPFFKKIVLFAFYFWGDL